MRSLELPRLLVGGVVGSEGDSWGGSGTISMAAPAGGGCAQVSTGEPHEVRRGWLAARKAQPRQATCGWRTCSVQHGSAA